MNQDLAIAIRPARPSEQAAIKKMVSSERLDPTRIQWENFLLAEVENQIVGCGQIRRYGGVRELGSLVVLPAYRKHGVGAALVQALMAKTESPLHLDCPRYRVPYYERFGFRVIPMSEVPKSMRWKIIVGSIFARIFVGVPVVAMRWDG